MTHRLPYQKISAAGIRALNAVHSYVQQSGLPVALIDLVYLRISQINGCAYCIDMHSRDILKAGIPIEKLVLVPVWREAVEMFTEKERAALAWAECVTNVAQTQVPDAEYQAASEHLSEKELVDLTIAIGLMNAFNRLAISFRATPAAVKELAGATTSATAS